MTDEPDQTTTRDTRLRLPRATSEISLFGRVLAVNAAILTAAVATLIFTPITVSRNITRFEVVVLLDRSRAEHRRERAPASAKPRPLRRLMEMMLVIDVVEPGCESCRTGPIEVASVIIRFNLMLDRLEHERRHSMRRCWSPRRPSGGAWRRSCMTRSARTSPRPCSS